MIPLPERLAREPGDRAVYTLRLDPAHPAFLGHFPGDPVLPGAVQVDWAIRLGEEAFGAPGPFRALERVKFLLPARPGETLELRLERSPDGSLAFEYLSGVRRVSSGRVRFGERP